MTADLPAAAAVPGTARIIEARDLFLSFGETPALRGASLAVQRGEIVAVMGPVSYTHLDVYKRQGWLSGADGS